MLWDALGCSGDALGRRCLGFSYAVKQSRARETNFEHKLVKKSRPFSDRLLLEMYDALGRVETRWDALGRPGTLWDALGTFWDVDFLGFRMP